jgi:hypothetical protein
LRDGGAAIEVLMVSGKRVTRTLALTLASLLLLQGCTVAKSMRVRSGNDPRYRDEEVRFRTTYYFRVFDACEGIGELENASLRSDTVFGGKAKGPYRLRTDSLYRFRMTGKASSLFQQIRFEAGTLRKEEIDPFGSAVVYDSRSNRFVFKSREETQSEARREARFADIDRLRTLREGFDKTTEAAARAEFDRIILQQIRALAPADVVEPAAAVRAMPVVANEVAVLRARTQALRGDLPGLVKAVDGAHGRLTTVNTDRLGTDDTVKSALDELQKARDALAGLAGLQDTAIEETSQAAIKGQEAQKAAADVAVALRGKTAVEAPAKEKVGTYGERAADFAVAVNKAALDVEKARDGARTAADGVQKARDAIAPVIAKLPVDRDHDGLARRSLTDLTAALGRLRAHEASWQELTEQSAGQADAAAQIAATSGIVAIAARQPAGGAGVAAASTAVICPSGTPARRGFQILGPEGWRTFDQDERLIMAMFTSAKPLTSTLQQLSRNVLNAQQVPSEALLPLVRERLRIVEAQEVAKRYEDAGGTVNQVIDDILATFNRDAASGAGR